MGKLKHQEINSSKITQLLSSWDLNSSRICMLNPTTHDALLYPKSFIFFILSNFLQTTMSIEVYPGEQTPHQVI